MRRYRTAGAWLPLLLAAGPLAAQSPESDLPVAALPAPDFVMPDPDEGLLAQLAVRDPADRFSVTPGLVVLPADPVFGAPTPRAAGS